MFLLSFLVCPVSYMCVFSPSSLSRALITVQKTCCFSVRPFLSTVFLMETLNSTFIDTSTAITCLFIFHNIHPFNLLSTVTPWNRQQCWFHMLPFTPPVATLSLRINIGFEIIAITLSLCLFKLYWFFFRWFFVYSILDYWHKISYLNTHFVIASCHRIRCFGVVPCTFSFYKFSCLVLCFSSALSDETIHFILFRSLHLILITISNGFGAIFIIYFPQTDSYTFWQENTIFFVLCA